jgi:outer membrane protein assembly factor BamB
MRLSPHRLLAALLLLSPATLTAEPRPDGWFQFRGPTRDGHSSETGLVRSWSAEGPPELWRRPIGPAFSGLSIVAGRVFTMDSDGEREHAICLDAKTGAELWRVPMGALFEESYGDGPRSTPTVRDGLVYALGARGRLAALRVENGDIVWQIELADAFTSPLPRWAFTTSAIVEGDLLVLEVGGTGPRAVAAFDRASGEMRWTAVEDALAYSSPIAVDLAGRRQLVFLTKSQLFGLSPTGELLWSTPFSPDHDITPASPLLIEPDLVMVSASYDVGAKVVRVTSSDTGIAVDTVWEGRQMRNHFNSSVVVDGYAYGFDTATLRCLDARTGQRRWAQRGLGKGSLIVADGMLITLSGRGKLLLLEATPEGYNELAAHQVLKGRCWTQPALWQGRLYLRNHEEAVALDLRDPGKEAD